jgi:hypothetical protein
MPYYVNVAVPMAVWQAVYTHLCHTDGMDKPGDETTKTTFRMPKSMLKAVKHYATDHEMTDTEVFLQALNLWMEKEAKKETDRKR